LTVAKPEVADALKGATISTFGGNPMAATAGKAVLDFIEEQNLRVNAAEVGAYLRDKLLEYSVGSERPDTSPTSRDRHRAVDHGDRDGGERLGRRPLYDSAGRCVEHAAVAGTGDSPVGHAVDGAALVGARRRERPHLFARPRQHDVPAGEHQTTPVRDGGERCQDLGSAGVGRRAVGVGGRGGAGAAGRVTAPGQGVPGHDTDCYDAGAA
jgi:hypothetical protein